MYSIGFDIGSSSIKGAIVEMSSGMVVATASHPEYEMKIDAPNEGWAEQDPDIWWKSVCIVTQQLLKRTSIDPSSILSIGIAYQMHGLVLVGKDCQVLRPAIIWCDSRAIEIGEKALAELGHEYCFDNLLNSPGNFTASKLRWVKENEPEIFDKVHKILLPGDYISMKMTGEINSTLSGLSEGILWDFVESDISTKLLDYYEIPKTYIPKVVDTFGIQGRLRQGAADEIGLHPNTPLTYRAGDQPNNAMSLRVMSPGEIAASGGTSGVVYGISDKLLSDKESRTNAFAHVNHNISQTRIGQLLCINGAGSQYAWIKKQIGLNDQSYFDMENAIDNIPVGSEGLLVLPFGNGAERMLNNAQTGAQFNNVQFNIHTREHFYRAAIEGIAFSFVYGIQKMEALGIIPKTIRVGNDNLFQSQTFSKTICTLLGCNIEMMETNGAIGAAKVSRLGIGEFRKPEEAIESSQTIKTYTPNSSTEIYQNAYKAWESSLINLIDQTSDKN